jgi:hypothetical protein
MAENDKSYVHVEVEGIVRDQRENPIVLLRSTESEEVLPIWIGHSEALAIELKLQGKTFERPLTHDLLKTTLDTFGASVAKVVVTELKDNTFFAKIYIQRDKEIIVVDARPSDSIALALRTKSPIFVSEEVFESHKRSLQSDDGKQNSADEKLRRYLRDLDPGEF